MKENSTLLATFFTPPAVILNVMQLIGDQVNILLLIAISVVTLIYWGISIKNKRLQNKKEKLEIELLEKQLKEND
jgi:hypothetical protein